MRDVAVTTDHLAHVHSRFVAAAVSVEVAFAARVEAFPAAHPSPSPATPAPPTATPPRRPVSRRPEGDTEDVLTSHNNNNKAAVIFWFHQEAFHRVPPPLIAALHTHSLVHRELPHSLRLFLGRFFEAPLTGRSPLRPLVSGSAFALPALMLGPRLALLVRSSAHPPDA